MHTLIFATRNTHKLDELRGLLAAAEPGQGLVELIDLDAAGVAGDPPETGDTFVHNALQKAQWVWDRTGLPCLADDSGLEVDALAGAPGVYSKRFSAEATPESNNLLLLSRLGERPDRRARFRCVLALVARHPAGHLVTGTVEGVCEGEIAREPHGSDGFGYDPLFVPDAPLGGSRRTLAQLSMTEKNAISHRGAAFRKLPALLRLLA